jgi:superfamily II DNA or RNA helicase
LTFLAPYDRPAPADTAARPRRARPQEAAAWLARLVAARAGYTALAAARDARVDLLAYQLEPALAVLAGTRRVLIADEVGLGKTIQAGLVAAEIQQRRGAIRALVICPAALCEQWREELVARFALEARVAGAEALGSAVSGLSAGDTPWRRTGVWIGSFDYLKQPHVLEGIPLTPWDLLVIDEAHEAAGETHRHAACEELARRARCVLLLTATPHSGDSARFARLLALGAHPDAGPMPGSRATPVANGEPRPVSDTPAVFQRTRADVALTIVRRVRWHVVRPSIDESRLLDALSDCERTLLHDAGRAHRDAALLLLSVYRKRALSSSAALARSLERRLEWLLAPERVWSLDWTQPRLEFDADEVSGEERAALTLDVGWHAADERAWLRRLHALARAASGRETKARRLARLLQRRPEPAIVFTEFRDSLDALRRQLDPVRTLSLLHGGQSRAERDAELRRFLDGASDLLLTTDVAGQGLNLQSRARWVLSLELPWNPARLEQRIGRVDRIGQARAVHATLLVSGHAGENGLLRSLARRTLTARRVLGHRVLASLTPPSEVMVARSLLADEPLPAESALPPVPLAGGWRRRARALAHLLSRKRALARLWRGQEPAGRARWCTWRVRGRPGVSGTAVAVFSVPLIDRGGTELERALIVLAGWPPAASCAEAGPGACVDRLVPYARRIARERLDSRRRRLERLLEVAGRRAAAHERAIGAWLHARRYPEQAQAALFTSGPVRAFARHRDEARALEAATADRIGAAERAAKVTVGEPRLELFFTPR